MVREQLAARGITDERVLDAMASVPRHVFVAPACQREAYADHPIPIGYGQTISQPFIVALSLQALELTGGENVLDVGTGSGYQAALLGRLAQRVTTIERVPQLVETARRALRRIGCDNVHVVGGDGRRGFEPSSPYDAIVVAAGAARAPAPLLDQLANGGRLVIPLGIDEPQMLTVLRKVGQRIEPRELCPCMFVPLVSQ